MMRSAALARHSHHAVSEPHDAHVRAIVLPQLEGVGHCWATDAAAPYQRLLL